jgi:hypothetical protein
MKSIITFCAVILMTASVFAQSPNKMSYQAVIRNSSNVLVTSSAVGMRISILQTSPSGTAVYVETQTPTTNANGLVSIEIGGGTVVLGSINTINWVNGPFFIKTETDPAGGSNYSITGTSQLLSVPYALYSATSGSSIPGPQGPQGPAGNNGAPGTQGAVGPQGLQGPQGQAGATGPTGTQGPIGLTGPAGPQGAIGLTGAQGPQGPAGANGINGADGKTVLNGTSNPTSLIGNNGDFYINTISNIIFGPKASGQWPVVGVSLVGPQGLTGTTGASGPQGQAGATGPTGTQGPIGLTGLAGPQGAIGLTGPQGPQGPAGANGINGADGKTVLNGTSNPTSLIGNNGDFYINTISNIIFGPKASGQWPAVGVYLVGPQGLTGPTGASGPQGPQGPPGGGGFTHYVGQPFGGGVIFYLEKDTNGIEHGLVCHTEFLCQACSWSNITSGWVGIPPSSSNLGTNGLVWSNMIVSQNGHTNSAAKLCLDLVSNGYNDWYLPSIEELYQLWANRYAVIKGLSTIPGAITINGSTYWSSYEYNSAGAYYMSFLLGAQVHVGSINKSTSTLSVRAIRAF